VQGGSRHAHAACRIGIDARRRLIGLPHGEGDEHNGAVSASAVLIQPPLSLSRDFIDYPYHCDLGVVQAAAALRQNGADVRVVDAFALAGAGLQPQRDGERVLRVLMGASLDRVLEAVERTADSTGALVVSYTPFHRPPGRDATLGELLERLRSRFPDTPIVLADLYQSGQHYVEAPGEKILASYPEADVLLKYEAEARLPALLAELGGKRPAQPTVHRGSEPPHLDALALPAWDLIDLAARDAI
jgi:hypothetical protein